MAEQRDLQPHAKSHRVVRLTSRSGYTLGEGQRAEDVLAIGADLLRSEGIDPAWPGFDEEEQS
jgi:hypothetical protein